jgi:hypothetical protein
MVHQLSRKYYARIFLNSGLTFTVSLTRPTTDPTVPINWKKLCIRRILYDTCPTLKPGRTYSLFTASYPAAHSQSIRRPRKFPRAAYTSQGRGSDSSLPGWPASGKAGQGRAVLKDERPDAGVDVALGRVMYRSPPRMPQPGPASSRQWRTITNTTGEVRAALPEAVSAAGGRWTGSSPRIR